MEVEQENDNIGFGLRRFPSRKEAKQKNALARYREIGDRKPARKHSRRSVNAE